MTSTETPSPLTEEALRAEFNRTIPDSYREIIEETGFEGLPSINASNWIAQAILKGLRCLDDGEDFAKILAEVGLSEQGELIARTVRGRDFIDLACGNPIRSPALRAIARVFGAKRYFGIDADWETLVSTQVPTKIPMKEIMFTPNVGWLLKHRLERLRTSEEEGLPIAWIEDDALGFLAKIPKLNGAVFTICAMQGASPSTVPRYYNALVDEIDRLAIDGDMVFVVQAEKPLIQALINKGFDYDHSQSEVYLRLRCVFTKRTPVATIVKTTATETGDALIDEAKREEK